MANSDRKFDVLVIGGGINGLCTAYHLQRMGCAKVGVIDQFELGHHLGSSHGAARITRSTYADRDYVDLMTLVHRDEWPRLEKDTHSKLIHRTPGCFFGPPCDKFDSYRSAMEAAGAEVETLTVPEARKVFPLFSFTGAECVLHDRTAGVIEAEGTINALTNFLGRSKVSILAEEPVLSIDWDVSPIRIQTKQQTLLADNLVVTAGSWAAQLVPQLRGHLAVARQSVGYFELDVPTEQTEVGNFPVWVSIEPGENEVHYGLPAFGGPGIKVARHVTAGREDSPFDHLEIPPDEAMEPLRAFLERILTCGVGACVAREHCVYTNTATEDFILDRHPDNPRVILGAGFSGHGFKFGPWTGRVLAEMALDCVPADPVTRRMLARLRLPSTRL